MLSQDSQPPWGFSGGRKRHTQATPPFWEPFASLMTVHQQRLAAPLPPTPRSSLARQMAAKVRPMQGLDRPLQKHCWPGFWGNPPQLRTTIHIASRISSFSHPCLPAVRHCGTACANNRIRGLPCSKDEEASEFCRFKQGLIDPCVMNLAANVAPAPDSPSQSVIY